MVAGGRELIDTLWNVNEAIHIQRETADTELIDTLWNVNIINQWDFTLAFWELIDTLWNVNLTALEETANMQPN